MKILLCIKNSVPSVYPLELVNLVKIVHFKFCYNRQKRNFCKIRTLINIVNTTTSCLRLTQSLVAKFMLLKRL